MDAVNSFNTLVAGFLIGWWMRDISHWLRARLEPTATAPSRARHVDSDPAEPPAASTPRGNPGDGGSPRDAQGTADRQHGGDDLNHSPEVFHAAILPQKQEAGK